MEGSENTRKKLRGRRRGSGAATDAQGTPVVLRRSPRLMEKQALAMNQVLVLMEEEEDEQFVLEEKERLYYESIFPAEVWLIIFNNLKDSPETLERVSNSNAYFRALLLPQRAEFLFPQVWSILGKKIYPDKTKGPLEAINHWKVWSPQVLRMRLVCSTWCAGVDTFFRELEQASSIDFECPTRLKTFRGNPWSGVGDDWAGLNLHVTGNNWAAFLNHFEASHGASPKRSPFVANSVGITVRWNDPLRSIHTFLQKYGEHVYHCTVDGRGEARCVSGYYVRLWLILVSMPNLRSLRVMDCCTNVRTEKNASALSDLVSYHDLPTWPDLKFMSLCKMYPPIASKLMSLNTHVPMLEVKASDASHLFKYRGINMLPSRLPNIQLLSTNKIESSLDLDWLSVKVHWKPEALKLLVNPDVDVSELFHVLSTKFGDCLKSLIILYSHPLTERSDTELMLKSSMLRLHLPKLVSLKITNVNFYSLDFLLPMKNSLRIAYLQVPGLLKTRGKQVSRFVKKLEIVQYLSRRRNMEKSNIWTLFPNLNELYLEEEDKFQPRCWVRNET